MCVGVCKFKLIYLFGSFFYDPDNWNSNGLLQICVIMGKCQWIITYYMFNYLFAQSLSSCCSCFNGIEFAACVYSTAMPHTSLHPSIHPSIHTYIHTYIHASMHPCTHASMHTYIHAYTQVDRQTDIHTHTFSVYIYIYTILYTHAHLQLHAVCIHFHMQILHMIYKYLNTLCGSCHSWITTPFVASTPCGLSNNHALWADWKGQDGGIKPRNPAGNYLNGCNLITAQVMKSLEWQNVNTVST